MTSPWTLPFRDVTGSLGGGSKVGAMVRQSPLEDSRFAMIGISDTPDLRFLASRTIEGENVETASLDFPRSFPQLFSVVREGASYSMTYSDNGIVWAAIGDPLEVEMLDPVLVGIPLANLSAGMGKVEIDYVRARTVVLPTPTAQLGAEQ